MIVEEKITDLERLELNLLLQAIHECHGYDFRDYAMPSLWRQVRRFARQEGLSTISGVQERILHDTSVLKKFLLHISVSTTSLFRDPGFYKVFRKRVVPLLRTFPYIRIWHAGCSTGEEVYSMAILLHEEGLYERSRIYATDFHESVLQEAKSGTFPAENLKEYTNNYHDAGGTGPFTDYYTEKEQGFAVFNSYLSKNITFAQHNLVTDNSFMEFNAVFCRNVLIYFNRTLQDKVHNLIYESLCRFGVLSLGKKESIQFTSREPYYRELDPQHKLYQRIR